MDVNSFPLLMSCTLMYFLFWKSLILLCPVRGGTFRLSVLKRGNFWFLPFYEGSFYFVFVFVLTDCQRETKIVVRDCEDSSVTDINMEEGLK